MDSDAGEDDTDAGDVENQTDKAKEVAEMRMIIDSDMARMPRNCHECYLCYGGWCTVMPAEQDEMCPDRDKPEWCPLSLDDEQVIDAIPVSFVDDLMHGDDPDVSKAAWRVMRAWRKHEHEAD